MNRSEFEAMFADAVKKNASILDVSEEEWNRSFSDGLSPDAVLAFAMTKMSDYVNSLVHDALLSALVKEPSSDHTPS